MSLGRRLFGGRGSAGFTLIELLVVMAILASCYAFVAPRLPKLASTERSEALKRLALSSSALFEHAAVKKKV